MQMLPPNQKIFVDEYVKDRNGKRAAIASGYSEKTAEQQASRLLRNVKVKAAIDLILLNAQKRAETTLDDILNELDENRKAALTAETVQSSAATAATMAKAKLLGFVVEKQSVKHEGLIEVDIAPKLSREDWMKAHGLVATAGHTK
jgi:phage terminase small subunit